MGTLLVKAGSLAITILRRSSSYQNDVIQDQRSQTTEATRRIVSQHVARGARRSESGNPACPRPQGTRVGVYARSLSTCQGQYYNELVPSGSNLLSAAKQCAVKSG